MNDSSRDPDQMIDEALARRPLATLPAGFVERVMAQVQDTQAPALRELVRYKLEPLDVALPMLVACMVLLAVALSGQLAFVNLAIPPGWSAIFPTANLSLPWAWAASNWMVLVGLLVSAEISLGILFCASLWLDPS